MTAERDIVEEIATEEFRNWEQLRVLTLRANKEILRLRAALSDTEEALNTSEAALFLLKSRVAKAIAPVIKKQCGWLHESLSRPEQNALASLAAELTDGE